MQERTKMADICYTAWKMCMICRDQDQQMECHSSCMETTMTLQNCMTMIMLNNPHAIDMIKVSVASTIFFKSLVNCHFLTFLRSG